VCNDKKRKKAKKRILLPDVEHANDFIALKVANKTVKKLYFFFTSTVKAALIN
jgi:hypothetical protein